MRKLLKWFLVALGALAAFMAVSMLLLFVLSQAMLKRTDDWNYYRSEQNTVSLMAYKGDAEVLVIPDTMDGLPVTQLNPFAFETDTLREVTLPAAVTGVSTVLFHSCPSLEAIHVAEGCAGYSSVNGLLMSADGRQLLIIPTALAACEVPLGTEVVTGYCGYDHASLRQLTLPEGLIRLEDGAFARCEQLREANIPASVTEIGNLVFDRCPDLTLTVTAGTAGEAYAIEHAIPYRLAE